MRLKIGSIRTTDFRTFIPVEPQPAKRVQNWTKGRIDISLLIRIVDAQNKLATISARPQPTEQSRPHSADMHVSGRAGGKASSNRHIRISVENRRLKHLQDVAPHQSNLMRLKQRQEFRDRACSEQRFLRIPERSRIVTGRVPSSNAKSRSGPPDSIISARLLRVGREK